MEIWKLNSKQVAYIITSVEILQHPSINTDSGIKYFSKEEYKEFIKTFYENIENDYIFSNGCTVIKDKGPLKFYEENKCFFSIIVEKHLKRISSFKQLLSKRVYTGFIDLNDIIKEKGTKLGVINLSDYQNEKDIINYFATFEGDNPENICFTLNILKHFNKL